MGPTWGLTCRTWAQDDDPPMPGVLKDDSEKEEEEMRVVCWRTALE